MENKEVVINIYKQILKRNPLPEEIKNGIIQLKNGISIENFMKLIHDSPEFIKKSKKKKINLETSKVENPIISTLNAKENIFKPKFMVFNDLYRNSTISEPIINKKIHLIINEENSNNMLSVKRILVVGIIKDFSQYSDIVKEKISELEFNIQKLCVYIFDNFSTDNSVEILNKWIVDNKNIYCQSETDIIDFRKVIQKFGKEFDNVLLIDFKYCGNMTMNMIQECYSQNKNQDNNFLDVSTIEMNDKVICQLYPYLPNYNYFFEFLNDY